MQSELAIIGGSQAYDLLRSGDICGDRLGPGNTPFGPSQPIYRLHGEFENALFLSRHGEKGYSLTAPFVNYRANIYALKEMGAKRIISWSGPGAINTGFKIGQYVVVDDIIDETRQRRSTFFEGMGVGFVRQNPVFCPTLRRSICHSLKALSAGFADKGTYVCTDGPRLETPAEIRKYSVCGGDLVGMTLSPEVFLAKELEMCYASVCYITNYAEGVVDRPFKPGELFEGLASDDDRGLVRDAVANFPVILKKIIGQLHSARYDCVCQMLMERHRQRGDVGEDWRTWVSNG